VTSAVPVFLWDNHVAVPGAAFTPLAVSEEGGDWLTAFRDCIEQMEPKPSAIRILYGSPTLNQKVTACTKGSREDVRQGLVENFAALSRPETAWAAHKVHLRSGGTDATTILYTEESDSLAILRSMLEEIGVRLEGVFPILTALEALPAIGNRAVPVVALLRSKFSAMVFWATASGHRSVRVFHSEASDAELNEELADSFATIEDKDRLTFLVMDVTGDPLTLESHGVTPKDLGVEDLLQAVKALDAKGLSNLLPPSRKLRMDAILYGLSVLLVIGGFFGWGSYEMQVRKNDSDLAAQKAEGARIRTENDRLLANERRIERAQAVLDEASIAPTVKLKFLHALNAARPVAISIRSVTMTDRKWVVAGFIHEGLQQENGPFQTFLKNLAESKDWELSQETKATLQKTQDFTITGVFN
jgi:hypothetical protein